MGGGQIAFPLVPVLQGVILRRRPQSTSPKVLFGSGVYTANYYSPVMPIKNRH